jgi:FeS assembly SUF system regulator
MIKLSRMADYSVVLMTQLAREKGALTTAADLSSSCALPLPTVSKLLKQLAQEALLDSHRGTKGGYALARAATDISMADIIGAVEGPIALTDCIEADGTVCEIEALCPTRTNWRRINDVLTQALDGVSLAEMVMPTIDFMTLFPVRETTDGLEERAE